MGRFFVSVLLLLALSACGKSDNATDQKAATAKAPVGQPPAVKPPDGPILGMMVAGSIDAMGKLVGQTFTFSPDQPQITVIARIGKVAAGSSIRFAWFQETDGDDKALFDHTVKVASFDRAYSEGKNPGKLAVGRYKVIATLDGKTHEIQFAVATRSTKSAPRVSRSALEWLAAFGVRTAHAEGSPAAGPNGGQPPTAGHSGVIPKYDKNQPDDNYWSFEVNSDHGDLDVPEGGTVVDRVADMIELTIETATRPPEPVPDVVMTVGEGAIPTPPPRDPNKVDPAVEAAWPSSHPRSTEPHFVDIRIWSFAINPCSSNVGSAPSDLPGAKYPVSVRLVGGKNNGLTRKFWVVLGDDTRAPNLQVAFVPPKNSKVKAGQKIDISVDATEYSYPGYGAPWQTGVRWIQVTSPEGLVGDSWTNPSKLPKACDEKTKQQTYKTTYLVPKNPKVSILLCAVTQDYAENENSKCATFFTGDVWSGTWHEDSNRSYKNFTTGAEVMKCNDTWDGTLSFAVGADGAVEGTAIAKLASGPACTLDRLSVVKVQEVAYTVVGHKTSTGFELHFKFDHNTPIGSNMGGNVVLLGPHDCVGSNAQPPPVFLDRTTADNVASGRFTATSSPLCGGSAHDVLAVDAHLEVTRQ